MSRFICVETHPNGAWAVYELFHCMDGEARRYIRYDNGDVRFYTSREACEAEVARLNQEDYDD